MTLAEVVPPSPTSSPSPLAEHLARRVAPLALAGERSVPVDAWLAALVPQGALVRGQIVSCPGPWGPSTALATVAAATRAGSWLALIGDPELGIEAAAELGVELGRVVGVDIASDDAEGWLAATAAAVDGIELVVTRVPRRIAAGALRRLQARIQHRGAVVVTVGASGELASDVVVEAVGARWEGLGAGHGRLRARTVTVEVSGRRVPRRRRGELRWPAPVGDTGDGGGHTLRPVG
jgi:hypothetical protein